VSNVTNKIVSAIELPALARGPVGVEHGAAVGERLDLVGHVKVKMNVTLGQAEIALDRLFALANGDVLALDRDVDAPVDVRLHGKLIARGHIVAVGDKFGVRISEIAAD
jgi:flagellar motor switch protein FliN/FliY